MHASKRAFHYGQHYHICQRVLPRTVPHASPRNPSKSSKLVQNETILLVFQVDLDVQLQRCLNYEQYELAKEVREKRTQVDLALEGIIQRKLAQQSKQDGEAMGATPGRILTPSDFAAEGLRLRMDMQRAVEGEDYKEAARLRDLVAALDQEQRKAEAALSASSSTFCLEPILRLGQRVKHKDEGYRGVVVGWDQSCCETDEWRSFQPPGSTTGPYYHLLVDERDWLGEDEEVSLPPMAYVPTALLFAPEIDPAPLVDEGGPTVVDEGGPTVVDGGSQEPIKESGVKSWKEVFGDDPFQHPFVETLFLGRDSMGDYIPCRKLRDKYNVARRNV